jgi:hypothetical protein
MHPTHSAQSDGNPPRKILDFPVSAVVKPPRATEGDSRIVHSRKEAEMLLQRHFRRPPSLMQYSYRPLAAAGELHTFIVYPGSGPAGWSNQSWIEAAQMAVDEDLKRERHGR